MLMYVCMTVCLDPVSSQVCPTVNDSVVRCIEHLLLILLFASNRRLQVSEQNTSSSSPEATDETQELLESYVPQTLCWKVGTNSQKVCVTHTHTHRDTILLLLLRLQLN